MSKVDWLTAIEKGMVAAQAEKTNPCLKTVGTGGDGGDFYGNENNINVSQTEGPVPTTQILVGTGGIGLYDTLEAAAKAYDRVTRRRRARGSTVSKGHGKQRSC